MPEDLLLLRIMSILGSTQQTTNNQISQVHHTSVPRQAILTSHISNQRTAMGLIRFSSRTALSLAAVTFDEANNLRRLCKSWTGHLLPSLSLLLQYLKIPTPRYEKYHCNYLVLSKSEGACHPRQRLPKILLPELVY